MSIDRYLSVKIKKWRAQYFKSKTAIILSICVGAAIMIMNLTFVSLISYDSVKSNITCFTHNVFAKQMQVYSKNR